MREWKKISQKEQKVGYKIITAKQFVLPNGEQSEFTTFHRVGNENVAVIAVTIDNRVVVARQFRPGPERILDELPGGGVETGENLEVAVARELLEETGYASDGLFQYLGHAYRDAYANATNHYYLATNCYEKGKQELDETEFVDICLISIDQLMTNAKKGMMTDSVAVLMADEKLQKINRGNN